MTTALRTLPVLVYDGDCGICTRLAAFTRRRVRPQVAIRAWQDLDLEHYGLTAEQCDEALRLVDTQGRVHTAQDAVAGVLRLGAPPWRPLGAVLSSPGVNALAGVVYRWVARNRYRLPGGTPACALPGHDCPAAASPGADS